MHEYQFELLQDSGQVQADALCLKQDNLVWMAPAVMVKGRVQLGSATSMQRDLSLSWRLLRAGAAWHVVSC